jgi:hypothetical protein
MHGKLWRVCLFYFFTYHLRDNSRDSKSQAIHALRSTKLNWILEEVCLAAHGIELVIYIHFPGTNSWPSSHSEHKSRKSSELGAPSSRPQELPSSTLHHRVFIVHASHGDLGNLVSLSTVYISSLSVPCTSHPWLWAEDGVELIEAGTNEGACCCWERCFLQDGGVAFMGAGGHVVGSLR